MKEIECLTEDIIDSAGVHNLSDGVKLGSISWHMKMVSALHDAKEARRAELEGGAA